MQQDLWMKVDGGKMYLPQVHFAKLKPVILYALWDAPLDAEREGPSLIVNYYDEKPEGATEFATQEELIAAIRQAMGCKD